MPDAPPVLREGEPICIGERQIGFTLFARGDMKSDPRQTASNPWEVISQHLAHLEQRQTGLSALVKNARNYLRQAVDLFRASQHARPPTRPLLLYYCFLNLAVLLWMCRNKTSSPAPMNHGIKELRKLDYEAALDLETKVVKVQRDNRNPPESVVLRLAQAIDVHWTIPQNGRDFNLRQLLKRVPAVHRQYLHDGQDRQHIFRAVRSGFYHTANSPGKKGQAWVELTVEDLDKEALERLVNTDHQFGSHFLRGRRETGSIQNETREDPSADKPYEFHSKPVAYSNNPIETIPHLCKVCREAGMMAILTNSGYRYYVSDYANDPPIDYLIASYLAMFYLGSIARYQPGLLADMLGAEHGWLLNEFLASQGHQFVFHIASYVTGREVALPQAAGRGAEAW